MSANPSLPSWSAGAARTAIVDFVTSVTTQGEPDFVEPADRVAVFDNDGTLWCEKPVLIQADFFLRRIGEMAHDDRSLRDQQPWKAVVEGDHEWLGNAITKHYQGDDSDLNVLAVGILRAYADVTIEEFEQQSLDFLRTSQHPVLKLPYLACTYQPMVELLRYLEANGFTNYIVSGGGRDFMRPVTLDLYGVPRECVIGSTIVLEYRDDGDVADIIRKPELDIFDDGPAKPVRIWSRIGRRPILAAGNSNGDIEMLRFTSHASRPSLSLLVNHDDADREFAYQTGAEDVLNRAQALGWTVISMQSDWTTVFSNIGDQPAP